MSRRMIFRFEGDFKPSIGDVISVVEWRVVREGLPLEALKIEDSLHKQVFISRTGSIEMLNPVNKANIKGRVVGFKEKYNVKTQTPIILFEVETE